MDKDVGVLRTHNAKSDVTEGSVLSLLAEKCEQATGPDRELDHDIEVAVNGGRKDRELGFECLFPTVTRKHERIEVPYYTSSIDAAMKLVPDFINRRWYIADSDANSGEKAVATVYHPADMIKTGKIPRSVGATPALALCAAALKARKAQPGDTVSADGGESLCASSLNKSDPAASGGAE